MLANFMTNEEILATLTNVDTSEINSHDITILLERFEDLVNVNYQMEQVLEHRSEEFPVQ